jgi:hypothetical protein
MTRETRDAGSALHQYAKARPSSARRGKLAVRPALD